MTTLSPVPTSPCCQARATPHFQQQHISVAVMHGGRRLPWLVPELQERNWPPPLIPGSEEVS